MEMTSYSLCITLPVIEDLTIGSYGVLSCMVDSKFDKILAWVWPQRKHTRSNGALSLRSSVLMTDGDAYFFIKEKDPVDDEQDGGSDGDGFVVVLNARSPLSAFFSL
ncbi:hypothetical protein CORC01_06009 [Colletotrichum orchidophilum]|uniref:Uncharacterized protein n=1 Tax=Colletotrichum orchidophilum TaxID=1209926 RepID=A0A1G4BBJ8_9PEZI|nr:uncharacterized protein CORC01_06009 [Colletotrichum orchidophilum]OHE98743.1 hypothetical protein CORC01_06009 [Colletotrichum orchidophilum]